MKKYLIFLLAMLVSVACNKQTVPQKTAEELNAVPARAEIVEEEVEEAPIVEREETIVEIDEEPPVDYLYFVIIGSFRSKENAMKYQAQIGEKGFSSILMKNEEGFYRVSVLSTDDITKAREEIRRIRTAYPEHGDTWLLIRKR